ncbi:hypothetical protein D3C72_1571720 [compost metagenome]
MPCRGAVFLDRTHIKRRHGKTGHCAGRGHCRGLLRAGIAAPGPVGHPGGPAGAGPGNVDGQRRRPGSQFADAVQPSRPVGPTAPPAEKRYRPIPLPLAVPGPEPGLGDALPAERAAVRFPRNRGGAGWPDPAVSPRTPEAAGRKRRAAASARYRLDLPVPHGIRLAGRGACPPHLCAVRSPHPRTEPRRAGRSGARAGAHLSSRAVDPGLVFRRRSARGRGRLCRPVPPGGRAIQTHGGWRHPPRRPGLDG